MASLRKLADDVSALFVAHARRVFRASLFVKAVLLPGAALVAAGAEAIEIAHGNVSTLTIVALAAIGLVFVGGVYVAITEFDAGKPSKIAANDVRGVRAHELLLSTPKW
jgi:hypothetical protein